MIPKDSLTSIGEIHKPHGVRGEVSATFDDPELNPMDLKCLILEMDGIPVPFFLESARRRGASSWLLRFEGAEDEAGAMKFSRHEIYVNKEEMPDSEQDGVYLADLVGYTVVADDEPVGEVEAVDDSTANILLIIRRKDNGKEAMLPFSDDLLQWIDTESQSLGLEIPGGVLDLNA